MSIEQIQHLEILLASKEIELKEVKRKLYNAGRIISEKNEEIERLKTDLAFSDKALREVKDNYQEQVMLTDIIRKRQARSTQ